jgi:hypothetical protein
MYSVTYIFQFPTKIKFRYPFATVFFLNASKERNPFTLKKKLFLRNFRSFGMSRSVDW